MRVAIIPARGGSKRIPKKNIKNFSGKPMIAHAISAAKESKLFEQIIVSTDSDEISTIARKYGAKVPFSRPAHLADDHTPTVPVISHAIEFLLSSGLNLTEVCCIYPCVPFMQSSDLIESLELFSNTSADYVFPIVKYPSAIQRALRKLPNGNMEPFYSQYTLTRTQDLETAYYDTGQFYWAHIDAWLEGKTIHSHGAGYEIPDWRVVDIDTPDDWNRAELMYSAYIERHR